MSQTSNDLLNENKLFGIEYVKVNHKGSMPSNHYHHHYEIYYQLSGERYYFIKDRSYYVKKGDLVVINMFDLHKTSYAGASGYERILINFKEEFLKDFLSVVKDINVVEIIKRPINIYKLTLSDQTFVEQLLNKLITENKDANKGSDTYLKLILLELLIFIGRQPVSPQHQYLEYPSALHKKISQVARHINLNFSDKLSLDILAAAFEVSPFYLCRTFKEVTGFSFVEYLNITRIKEAQKLLLNTELSVTEIAEKVGFDSSTHFGRVFKSITLLSPLKFRKINNTALSSKTK